MTAIGDFMQLGEVVLATSVTVTAQCATGPRQESFFPDPPELGSFVYFPSNVANVVSPQLSDTVEEPDPFALPAVVSLLDADTIFGTVSYIQTSSTDPGRRATALGISSQDELRLLQPQVFELLTVEFTVVLTSFTDAAGNVVHGLPPKPPRIHSFVYQCDQSQIVAVTHDLGFLRGLLGTSSNTNMVPSDDLASAAILCGWRSRQFDESYLVSAGKRLLRLLSNDYARFQSIMQRVSSARR